MRLTETGRARWGEILDAEKMKKCVWVRPKLVAVIEFLEWTEGDRLRHSKFVVLREDILGGNIELFGDLNPGGTKCEFCQKPSTLAQRQSGQIAPIQVQKIENKIADARGFGCEVLEAMKIRPPGLVQGYDFAVNNGVGGKIMERLSDLRESFVEVLVISRIQNRFLTGFDADGPIAVQLYFFCGAPRYVALRMRGQLGRRTDHVRCHIIPIRSSSSREAPIWRDRQTLPNWVLSGLPVNCLEWEDQSKEANFRDPIPSMATAQADSYLRFP